MTDSLSYIIKLGFPYSVSSTHCLENIAKGESEGLISFVMLI